MKRLFGKLFCRYPWGWDLRVPFGWITYSTCDRPIAKLYFSPDATPVHPWAIVLRRWRLPQAAAILLLLLMALPLWAVGTCTVTGPTQLGSGQPLFGQGAFVLVTIACTADAANGSFPATSIPGLANPYWQGYYLMRVEVNPGSPAPTANFAASVTDTNGVDQLAGQALALAATMPQAFSVGNTSSPLNGVQTLNLTGNAVNSAVVNINLYYGPPILASGPARVVAEQGTRWTPSLLSQPAVSTLATVSKAAAAGVRHVATCVSFSAINTTAIAAATQLQVNLRDGASGAGTVLWSQQLFLPVGPGQEVAPFSFCGGPWIGTPNTAMTLEFSALVTNLFESVAMTGYDIQ